MLEDLVRTALAKREEIIAKISSVGAEKEKVEKSWVQYYPRPHKATVAGVDAGWNYVEFRGFYLYAVGAVYAVLGAAGLDAKALQPDIGIAVPDEQSQPWSINRKLWLRGARMEIQAARSALDKAELVLMDGSLLARLVDATRWGKGTMTAQSWANPEFKEFREELERLSCEARGRIAFLSKETRSRAVFRGVLGDIYYVDRYTRTPGYTEPSYRPTRDTGVSELLDGVTIVYARLEPGAPAIRIDLPGRVDSAAVERLLDTIRASCVGGYPYPLIAAHNHATVTDKAVETIAALLGLDTEERARSVLRL